MMLFLVFICMSTVGGVPINPTTHSPVGTVLNDIQNPTTRAPVGTIVLNDTQNATSPAPVSVVSLNETHNVTSPATGSTTSVLEPPQEANAETLEELNESLVVQEGDILIPEDRNAVQTLWPNAMVPFDIGPDLAHQAPNIYAAFKMISDVTCIRFQARTTEVNYLRFQGGNGCASYVGCRGGAQTVYYSHTCSVGNLCHELIHALGLHHEHTRKDRDQYITVQWQNIMPGKQKNFKMKSGNTLNLPYDINSIMHYGEFFFTQDGSPTVLAKHGAGQMGQRTHLSPLDIEKLNRLYHCAERMYGR